MAFITERTINGSEDNALVMGQYSTSSIDSSVVRKLAFGSDWNVIRIGVSLAINSYPSQSYNRHCGLSMGVCSGSQAFGRTIGNETGFGFVTGCINKLFGFSQLPFRYVENVESGSFYVMDMINVGSIVTGSTVDQSGNVLYDYGRIPNLGSGILKRGILIYQISSSATGYTSTMYVYPSSSSLNVDVTSDELISALTSSSYPPSASGVGLVQRSFSDTEYNKTEYPLDNVFITWVGGTPLEIYNWYIYKVN